jgi:hypothetical protein
MVAGPASTAASMLMPAVPAAPAPPAARAVAPGTGTTPGVPARASRRAPDRRVGRISPKRNLEIPASPEAAVTTTTERLTFLEATAYRPPRFVPDYEQFGHVHVDPPKPLRRSSLPSECRFRRTPLAPPHRPLPDLTPRLPGR